MGTIVVVSVAVLGMVMCAKFPVTWVGYVGRSQTGASLDNSNTLF